MMENLLTPVGKKLLKLPSYIHKVFKSNKPHGRCPMDLGYAAEPFYMGKSFNSEQPSGYEVKYLRLNNKWKKLTHNKSVNGTQTIDTRPYMNYEEGLFTPPIQRETPHPNGLASSIDSTEFEHYILHPKQFVLMESAESLHVTDDKIVFIYPESNLTNLGLQVTHDNAIRSRYNGPITFGFFNQSQYPIILYKGMPLAVVLYFQSHEKQED